MQILVSPEDAHLLASHKWRISANGYVVRWSGGRLLLLHREILGAQPGAVVDHISGDRLDNRRENLRTCTNAENARNSKMRSHNKLGLKGVYQDAKSGTYRAQITCDGKQRCLGSFPTPELAKDAYDRAAKRLHGAFARLT